MQLPMYISGREVKPGITVGEYSRRAWTAMRRPAPASRASTVVKYRGPASLICMRCRYPCVYRTEMNDAPKPVSESALPSSMLTFENRDLELGRRDFRRRSVVVPRARGEHRKAALKLGRGGELALQGGRGLRAGRRRLREQRAAPPIPGRLHKICSWRHLLARLRRRLPRAMRKLTGDRTDRDNRWIKETAFVANCVIGHRHRVARVPRRARPGHRRSDAARAAQVAVSGGGHVLRRKPVIRRISKRSGRRRRAARKRSSGSRIGPPRSSRSSAASMDRSRCSSAWIRPACSKGVIVTEHREPYGYFSVDLPEVMAQFERKNVRDAFKVGQDIDAITRATITMESASRAMRNSSRRIARAYLVPPQQQAQQPAQ